MNDEDPFSKFDMQGIDRDVASYQQPERPSQRGAARALEPLVRRVLEQRPDLPSGKVLEILRSNCRAGALPQGKTFDREVAAICSKTRAEAMKTRKPGGVPSARRPSTVTKAGPRSRTVQAKGEILSEGIATADTTQAEHSAASPRLAHDAVTTTHPLVLYRGKFSGRTFVHGHAIREFFKAIHNADADATLKRLADAVMQDVEAQANLGNLHLDDRAILDAALELV